MDEASLILTLVHYFWDICDFIIYAPMASHPVGRMAVRHERGVELSHADMNETDDESDQRNNIFLSQ